MYERLAEPRCAPPLPALAQARGSDAFAEGMFWLAVIVAVTVAAVIAVVAVKRRIRRAAQADAPGFTIARLRELRDTGALTTAQYEVLVKQTTDHRRDT